MLYTLFISALLNFENLNEITTDLRPKRTGQSHTFYYLFIESNI